MAETQPTTTPNTPDPLANLYKMSRTAGLGTTEYVAINGAAVTAIILGVASSLAILANVLLAIPIVGVVFAVVAIRQIGHSNGTQGGRALAWGGLVLSLAFGGYVIGSQVRETLVHRQDTRELSGLIDQLGAATKAGDMDRAYALFSPQFQQRVPRDRFDNIFKMARSQPISGDLEYMRWNGVPFQFEAQTGAGDRVAAGAMHVKFSKSDNIMRTEMIFRNAGDGWRIYDIPSFFPAQAANASSSRQGQPQQRAQ